MLQLFITLSICVHYISLIRIHRLEFSVVIVIILMIFNNIIKINACQCRLENTIGPCILYCRGLYIIFKVNIYANRIIFLFFIDIMVKTNNSNLKT